jgi:hypothetical protein
MKMFNRASATTPDSSRTNPTRLAFLNILIGALAVVVAMLGYALISRHVLHPPVEPNRSNGKGVIQMDVLNGCGAAGAASTITGYLRSRGYDVVEVRNYKTFDVPESLVIDRTGTRSEAESVAAALGVKAENIVVQISPDYFVDVSLVIGKDYHTLKPLN